MSKEKKPKDAGKAKKSKQGKGEASDGPSVAAHPRAVAAVRRCKGFGGLVGFALAALLAHRAGLDLARTVERALLAGLAGYLLAWACAVTVWRQIVQAELRSVAERIAEQRPQMISLEGTPATPTRGSNPAGAPTDS